MVSLRTGAVGPLDPTASIAQNLPGSSPSLVFGGLALHTARDKDSLAEHSCTLLMI